MKRTVATSITDSSTIMYILLSRESVSQSKKMSKMECVSCTHWYKDEK